MDSVRGAVLWFAVGGPENACSPASAIPKRYARAVEAPSKHPLFLGLQWCGDGGHALVEPGAGHERRRKLHAPRTLHGRCRTAVDVRRVRPQDRPRRRKLVRGA